MEELVLTFEVTHIQKQGGGGRGVHCRLPLPCCASDTKTPSSDNEYGALVWIGAVRHPAQSGNMG